MKINMYYHEVCVSVCKLIRNTFVLNLNAFNYHQNILNEMNI